MQDISVPPFIVGRPVRADERLFGRDQLLKALQAHLATKQSINLIGERRMGKTSLLNHLLKLHNAPVSQSKSQLIVVRLDLQDNVNSTQEFYGLGLRELLEAFPSETIRATRTARLFQRLQERPTASHDEVKRVLESLRVLAWHPVLILDEFERMLEPDMQAVFPYPDFFNHLRALISDNLITMVVASKQPLLQYFTDPNRPSTLTSTFPTYFTPFTLEPVDASASDALLLQPSAYPLTTLEAKEARTWSRGHPCHLQVAGMAYYETKVANGTASWTRQRREELKQTNCFVAPESSNNQSAQQFITHRTRIFLCLCIFISAIVIISWWYKGNMLWSMSGKQWLRLAWLELPQWIGGMAQNIGNQIDDVAAWTIGIIIFIILFLVILGVATGQDVRGMLRRWLGLG